MIDLKSVIRDIPDFPKKGIIFKDIAPLLSDPVLFGQTIETLKNRYKEKKVDQVVGIEARGFIFASALAYALGSGMVMVRKPAKLPFKTYQETYSLEYGEDTIEIHQDAFKDGQRIIIVDDVLATGGTLAASINLVKNNFQIELLEAAFIIELNFLNGRQKLKDTPVHSVMNF